MEVNRIAGRGNTFKYAGAGTGTSPLPIHLAYFSGVPAANAGNAALYTSTQFASTTLLGYLATRNPNVSSAASNLWGTAANRTAAATAGMPANFFVVNPDLLGGAYLMYNGPFTAYNSLTFQLQKRFSAGLQMSASYAYAKGSGSYFYTVREERERGKSTGVVPHAFKINWAYQLPFGEGRQFGKDAGGVAKHLISGWEFDGAARIQVGRLYDFGNVSVVGMTDEELSSIFKLRSEIDSAGVERIYNLPDDVIVNSMRAYSVSATSATGYSGEAPTGRYIAPPSGPSCVQAIAGDCAPRHHYVSGPTFSEVNFSIVKRFPIKKLTGEMRVEIINVFNAINYTGWTISPTSTSQPPNQKTGYEVTSAYRDISDAQNPGGRLGQISWRISW
jgi:hypothetical protein